MMKGLHKDYHLLIILLLFTTACQMQTGQDLQIISNGEVHVFYSKGFRERAQRMSQQINKAAAYGDSMFGFKPDVRLLVLAEDEWSSFTDFPIYGMPHYSDQNTLIVAAENNPFWESFLPPPDKLDKAGREKIEQTNRDKNGNISMIRFFDLVALHELAHAFHKQAGLNMQRLWLQEFFANLFMFVYIAENEPELIPVLEVFSNMVVQSGTTGYEYLSLEDFQQHYDKIAREAPKNYGWYQSKMNLGAIKAYREAGPEILKELWQFLKSNEQIENDSVLLSRMKEQTNDTLAEVFSSWNQ